MIDPTMIPDEVVEAAAMADYSLIRAEHIEDHGYDLGHSPWEELHDTAKEYYKNHARAAIAAALAAWPGAEQTWMFEYKDCIALPLPQEKNNV